MATGWAAEGAVQDQIDATVKDAIELAQVIVRELNTEGYNTLHAVNGAAGLALHQNQSVDLVILDWMLPGGMDGVELLRRIRQRDNTPVLMLTSISSTSDEIAGIQAGADEYLSKPVHPEVFRTRIRALIRHKVAIDRLEESETILFALAQAVEKRDHHTAGHCQRLAIFSVAFGMRLGLAQGQLLALHRGGFLHDIGKIAIPDSILFKPGKLTPEEWALMKTHSVRGEEICRPLRSLEKVLPIIRHHHERWDGGGYPDGLRGEKIPLLARVLQLADAYDALTSERPYKPAYSSESAIETLISEANGGWRDPQLTELFVRLPFQELAAASAEFSQGEEDSFECSVRNLRENVMALAS